MKVKFFPRSENIPCEVCNHRNGAVMTFSSQTDARYQSSIYAGELYAFKNNIRIGAFVTNLLSGQYNNDLAITEQTGVYRHDVYFATDTWKNPNTGVIERIPDHFDTVWSSAGEEFFNVTAGDPKLLDIRHMDKKCMI
ncbi:hypothetical protein JCM19294_1143 [Nonlabens tegetincola]|uniref:Uncharacterized protein n=1 Tax=Nonlabens tegetincola TaxID=323273 RepID=A0A090Q168_9FLAO|nr:hypothetical protein [Nonlabens tegetincola]GAK96834.1 hypothetical protein JCM19294_1143 [Nonlabens tegetincola]